MNGRQHPLPQQFHGELDAEIQRLLDNDVVEVCFSPRGCSRLEPVFENNWVRAIVLYCPNGPHGCPILAVLKKSGKVRICCNFKNTVNKVLRSDSDKYQLMNMETIFHEIGPGQRYFSSLDMTSGYWHLLVNSYASHM